jgi:hypothetical protein
MTERQGAERRHAGTELFLRTAGLLAAAGGQANGGTALGIGAVLVGMLCFAVAERVMPDPSPSAVKPSPWMGEDTGGGVAPAPRGFWFLFLTGVAVAVTAGALVAFHTWSDVAHVLWASGLLWMVAAALRSWSAGRSRLAHPGVAMAGVLAVVAVAVSSWNLSSIPPEVHNDEAAVGVDALRLLRGRPLNVFTMGWYFCPLLHAAPAALGIALLGPDLTGLRAASVVMGAATVLATFAFARRWWGGRVALLAGLVLAVSRFFVHLSRTGYHYVGTPLTTMLVAWLATRLWQDLGLGAAVMGEVVLGLGVQGYYASRLVPVLFVVVWGAWLLGSETRLRAARVRGLLVALAAAGATAAPMIVYFWKSPFAFWFRTQQTSIFSTTAFAHLAGSYGTNSRGAIIRIHAGKALTMFNWSGDTSMQYGYGAAGLLEPVSAALLPLGLAVLLARPARRANVLALLWIVLPLVAGIVLTIDAPFYPRAAGVVPLVAVAVGLALHRWLASVARVVGARRGRAVAAGLAGAVVAVIAYQNLHTYFVAYAPHHRHSVVPEIAAWMRVHGRGKTTYMIGGDGLTLTHNTIRFLADGYATRDVADLPEFLAREGLDRSRSVFVIMPGGHPQLSLLDAAVGPLAVESHRVATALHFFTAIPVEAGG